ncbi:MAG: ECF transporter S component [Clostridia bacterium]|nr:ECF transporter S component [Clostridia bacterium]
MKNSKTSNKFTPVQALSIGAILTAIVVVMQMVGATIRFGTFSISLVLIPIIIGAALCGKYIGAWLGLVFGIVVLVSGDAAPFMAISVSGTITTVLLKGTLCGFFAGLVYELLSKINDWLGAYTSAFVCPVVNTGIFLLGCRIFFYNTIGEWAVGAGFGQNAAGYLFLGLAGVNFLIELGVNLVLCPIIVRVVNIARKSIK